MIWKVVIPGVSSLFRNGELVCSVVKEAPKAFRIETGDYQDGRTYPTLRLAQTAALNRFGAK